MPSDLKSETSRINGAKSHGPKTPEGKETSSRNSLKHGFTSRKTFILQTESHDEYRAFLAEHLTIHQPATPPEKELVEQMAIARWRIRRFVGAETVLIDCEMVRNREKVDKEFGPTDSDVHLALAIRSLADESRCLSLMSRDEARHQRCHGKAYAALRDLQQLRTSQPNPPSVSAGAPPDPPPVHPALSVENKIVPNERAPQGRKSPVGESPTPRRCRYTWIASEPDRRVTAGLGAS
jgi:hypothetical protein